MNPPILPREVVASRLAISTRILAAYERRGLIRAVRDGDLEGYPAAEVRRLSQRLAEALYDNADKRVIRRLLDLDDIYNGVIPLTQDDLATMAGTTRPTANRVLQGLVGAGLVALSRGRFQVLDRAELVHRAR